MAETPGSENRHSYFKYLHLLANKGQRVLYISGEESIRQTKLRAERLGVASDELYIYAETDLEQIHQTIEDVKPKFVIVDSIQTVHHPEVKSAPGSVSQVRECTAELMRIAKTQNIAIFLVGHVTKDGQIAGPRLLEHMVDTVLYFEGERHHTYRILRSVKNRFGSTNEIAIFEMLQSGLKEVLNPSELFLQERSQGGAGSTVVASMEGTDRFSSKFKRLLRLLALTIQNEWRQGLTKTGFRS